MSPDLFEIIRHHGFKRLLLAVSGGLDSICLAHYFIANRDALGIEWLGIAHVHHGLRTGTADRDAKFVETFAHKHNVPFFLKKLDGETLKAAEGSLEENARDARYKALVEIVDATGDSRLRGNDNVERGDDENNGDSGTEAGMTTSTQDDTSPVSCLSSIIVTAHHAGDQAETMYMRLRRGTTLAGLRGIQEIRILSNTQGVSTPTQEDKSFVFRLSSFVFLYRPFLNVTREELLAYARENNLTWCEDESNADVKFARNKVRHELLPQLERGYPGATKHLCRIAGLADKAYAKVKDACECVFGKAISDDLTPHPKATEGCAPTPLNTISLNKKKFRNVLLAHADADLSEMFRLWLSEQGFRFPVGFFYSPKEPAHVKIPHRAAFRKRAIAKTGPTVRICEFEDADTALKFLSCR